MNKASDQEIHDIFHDIEKRNKEITDPKIRTNIVYFTTKCNLGCTYCYEALDEVKGVDTSLEDIYKIVDDAIEREGFGAQTFFEIFGGEPTLCWENVEKFMDYAYSKKKNIYFEMITNGVKFTDINFISKVYNNKHMKEGRLSISISYDGWNGNADRIYRNGKESKMDVITALSYLSYLDLPFRIRYTIHSKNLFTIIEDIEKIIKSFKPLRIITSEVTEDIENVENGFNILKKAYYELQRKWQNNEITIPICDLFCESCDGCSLSRGKLQYYVQDKKYEKDSRSFEDFNHFETLKKDKS